MAHEIDTAVVGEAVDEVVAHRPHQLLLPAGQRLVAEGLGHQGAVELVLGLVHLEDAVAHHHPHHLGVHLAREMVVVAQHLADQVAAVHGEVLGAVGLAREVGDEVAVLDGSASTSLGQVGIRVSEVPRHHGGGLHRVVAEVVDRLGRGHAARLPRT